MKYTIDVCECTNRMICMLLLILLCSGNILRNSISIAAAASSSSGGDICTVNFGSYEDIVLLSTGGGAGGQKKHKKTKTLHNFVTKSKQQSIFYRSWFNCTGNLTSWSFSAKFNGANKAKHPELQIWRKVETFSPYYSRIASTIAQVTSENSNKVYTINLITPISVQYGDVIGLYQPDKKKSSLEMYLYSRDEMVYDYYFEKKTEAMSVVYIDDVETRDEEFPLITAVIVPSITLTSSSTTTTITTTSKSMIYSTTSSTLHHFTSSIISTTSLSSSSLLPSRTLTSSFVSSLTSLYSFHISTSTQQHYPTATPSLFPSRSLYLPSKNTIVMTTTLLSKKLTPTPGTVTIVTPIQTPTSTEGVYQSKNSIVLTSDFIHNVRTNFIEKSKTNNNVVPTLSMSYKSSNTIDSTPFAPPSVGVATSGNSASSSDSLNHMLVGSGVGLVGILVGVVISAIFVGLVVVLVKRRKERNEDRMLRRPRLAPYRTPNRYVQKNVPLYEGTSTLITVPLSNNVVNPAHHSIDHTHFNTLDSTQSSTLSSAHSGTLTTQSSTLNSTHSETQNSTHFGTLNSGHSGTLDSTHSLSSTHSNNALNSTHSNLSVTLCVPSNGIVGGVYEIIKEEGEEEHEEKREKCHVIQGSPYEKPVLLDVDSINNQDLYVPDEEQRRQILNSSCFEFDNKLYQSLYQAQHANDDENKTNNKKQFFQESKEYWKPQKTTGGIYRQLASKRYREIPRQNIQVTQYLGSGQFATVNKAQWLTGGGDVEVAVKMLKTGSSEQEKIKFLQEAAINGQFHHLNVVRLLGVVTVGEPVIIVLELLRNGNLKKYITSKRPKNGVPVSENLPQQLFNFCKQVAAGMEYLSKKTFIHRDLAARNILVSDQLICKVADFGMSRDLEESSYYISQGGLVPIKWTAPEAIFYRKYSTASDVWSYGVLMFEIWSLGRKPYSSLTNEQYIERIDEGERLAPPPGCPRPFYHLMMDCWHPEPIERPSFTSICQYLSQSKELLLNHGISQQELSEVASDATQIGAPLETGQLLFKDLQIRYLD